MMITLLMMVEMLETNPQKSVLHWKQGSSYIRDRLLQEQSTRRHKWKFPEIFLFRFSQSDQQSHLQEHAIAFKVPRWSEEPRCVHIKPPRSSIPVVDSRKVPHQHVKHLDAVLWKVQKNMWQGEQGKMFFMNSLKKLTCLGSSGPYSSCGILKESITISWQELSALVYGHRAWHGASCEEEKKRRICSCCVTYIWKEEKTFYDIVCALYKRKGKYILHCAGVEHAARVPLSWNHWANPLI